MKVKILLAGILFGAILTTTSSGVFADDRKIEVNTEKKEVFVSTNKDKTVGVFGQARSSEPTRENPKGEIRGVIGVEIRTK
jgi:hypothetical protein